MIGAWLLLAAPALAARPDSGMGAYSYDDSDVLDAVDGPEGLVRVHYSVEGPNQTILDDDDGNGWPDFPEQVAAEAEDVLDFYAGLGFSYPLGEEEMGLEPLGGSYAFDFYLVDFGGSADGMFATDTCSGGVCSGYMLMENDFRGYGYSSLDTAIKVLTSHELFHAVQNAYSAYEPDWLAEGTAVWAEFQYDPGNEDFLWFCDEYLDDTGRSIDSPPAGSVTSFSYGTALFFQFLTERLGEQVGPDIQAEMMGRDEDGALDAIVAAIADNGSTLEGEWPVFARWNLATGRRAGEAESYTFADELSGVDAEAEGASIADDNRFYPLAATYYRLDHPGGPLYFVAVDDPTGLVFSLHPVADGGEDGPVTDALVDWAPEGPGTVDLGEQPAGGYWLVGTHPLDADQSVKVEFCLGDAAGVEPCGGADTGGADTGGDIVEEPGGCACATSGGASGWLALPLALLGLARRRR